jgi:hypothetical protein
MHCSASKGYRLSGSHLPGYHLPGSHLLQVPFITLVRWLTPQLRMRGVSGGRDGGRGAGNEMWLARSIEGGLAMTAQKGWGCRMDFERSLTILITFLLAYCLKDLLILSA